MATATTNVQLTNQTTATAVLWGLGFSTAFQAAGLVKTSDTGQVDWTTVAPASPSNQSSSYWGYEIYKIPDAAGVSGSLYLKVRYGNGYPSGGTGYPMLVLELGTGTNGAGTLTNNLGYFGFGPYSSSQGLSGDHFFSAGPGRLCVAISCNNTSIESYPSPGIFVLERSRNADGTFNGNGVFWGCSTGPSSSGNSRQGSQFVGLDGGGNGPTYYNDWNYGGGPFPTLMPNSGIATGARGLNTPVYPIVPAAGAVGNPLQALMIGKRDDFFSGTPNYNISLTTYGASHTYKVLLPYTKNASFWQGSILGGVEMDSSNMVAPIMLWE